MTDILCDETNCIWCKDEECDAGKIVVSCGECRTFQDYIDLPAQSHYSIPTEKGWSA